MTCHSDDSVKLQTPANSVCRVVCSGANKSSPLKGLGLDCLQQGGSGMFADGLPQEPSIEQVAWAAGFFDGEGCILGKRTKDGAELVVTVTQNDRRPLELLMGWFGGSIEHEISKKFVYDRYRWVITRRKARLFLQAIAPYLVVKRERAQLALSVSASALLMIRNRPAA